MSHQHPTAGKLGARKVVPGHKGIYYHPVHDGRGGFRRMSGPYYAKIVEDGGRQAWRGPFETVAAASASRGMVAIDKHEGAPVTSSKMTFKQFALQWLADAHDQGGNNPISDGTYSVYERQYRNHIFPVIGGKNIGSVTVEDVSLVIRRMQAGETNGNVQSRASIDNAIKAMRGPLTRAVARGYLRANPIALLDNQQKPTFGGNQKGYRILSPAEMERLLDATGGNVDKAQLWKALIAVGLFAGLRIGEVLGLAWGDIDFDEGIIAVRRQFPQKLPKGVSAANAMPDDLPLPKNGKTRKVVLSGRLAKVLRELHMRQGRPAGDVFVFHGSRGRVMSAEGVRKMLAKVAVKAKLHEVDDPSRLHDIDADDFTYHQLRHTFASALIFAGLSEYDVSVQLGHGSDAITKKFYRHLFNERDSYGKARTAIDQAFGS